MQSIISGLSEKEAHDALNVTVAKDKAHEEVVCLGLLTVILTDPPNSSKVLLFYFDLINIYF